MDTELRALPVCEARLRTQDVKQNSGEGPHALSKLAALDGVTNPERLLLRASNELRPQTIQHRDEHCQREGDKRTDSEAAKPTNEKQAQTVSC